MTITCVVAALTAGSCASDASEPAGFAGQEQAEQEMADPRSGSPTPAPEAGGETEAIAQVFAAYWEAKVASENGPDADPALFDGIATGAVLERQVARVEDMIEGDRLRIGEPEIAELEITVDGGTATAVACIDQGPWRMVIGGETPPPPEATTLPIGVELVRIDGAWLVVEQFVAEEEVSC